LVKLRRNHAARLAMVALAVSAAGLLSCGSNGDVDDENGSPASPTATAGSPDVATPTPANIVPTPEPITGLEEAETALRDGRFEDAAEAFLHFGAQDPNPEVRAAAYLGAGVAWYEMGDVDRSLDALRQAFDEAPAESRTRRQAGYLLGVRYSERTWYADAATVLRPLYAAPVTDALQPYIDAAYGLASRRTNDLATAEAAWDRALGAPGIANSLRAAIFRDRATIALDEGNQQAAARWVSELIGVSDSSTDRFRLAEIALELGDVVTWEQQLRRIISGDPGSRLALQAIDELRAADYPVDGADEGYVYYRHRRYAEAREALIASLQESGLTPAQLAFRTYYLAAAYEDDGFYAQSIPLYDRVVEHDPTSPFSHRAQYWAARAAESLGDTEQASARHAAVAQAVPPGEFSRESAFRAGYVLLRGDDPAAAVATWDSLATARDPRALYWQGRAHEALGDTARAAEAYLAARAADPLSFHGMEAARRMGSGNDVSVDYEPIARAPAPDWDAIATWLNGGVPATAPQAPVSPANDFARIGLRTQARQAIQEIQGPPLARLRAAWELGMTDVVARQATSIIIASGEPGSVVPPDLLRLAYPLSYVTLLNQVGADYDFDPLFLAALIRVESFWDPDAVSVANARGLTQVIPPTGEAIARALGFDAWQVADLHRPVVSLEFGAYYISVQLNRFGDPHHALAAYNAGPGNAERWAAQPGSGSPVDFVEIVDFGETRMYVELVMSAYAHYRLAYRG
jgi:soluble lytic murein transglycosylase